MSSPNNLVQLYPIMFLWHFAVDQSYANISAIKTPFIKQNAFGKKLGLASSYASTAVSKEDV